MRIPLVKGDVQDKALMDELIRDTDIVIHLVAGDAKSIVEGTRIIATLCRKHRVSRMVHMSSAAVYGIRPNENHTSEIAPLKKTGEPYPDAKIKAEIIVKRETEKGLSSVVLRPRIVWGPYSPWIQTFYSQIREDTFCLVDNGEGACNTVYIDNLIDATLLAIESDRAVGEVFFVTDGERISWGTFYRRWASFLDHGIRFVSMDSSDYMRSEKPPGILQESKEFLTSPTLKSFLSEAPVLNKITRRVFHSLSNLPDHKKTWIKNLLGMQRPEMQMQYGNANPCSIDKGRTLRESGSGYTNIEKIKTLLGYRPRVDFATGCGLTRDWLSFAGILDARSGTGNRGLPRAEGKG
jgi:nucleoside-diphosphate-sugar epimerase